MPFFFIDHQGLKHPTTERWAYYGIDDPGICESLSESRPRDLTYGEEGQLEEASAYASAEDQNQAVASEIMSSPVVTILVNQSLQEAVNLFKANTIRHLPVLSKKNKLVGVLSERDVVRLLSDAQGTQTGEFLSKPVSSAMAPHALTVTTDTPVIQVAQLMQTERVGSLPVLEYPQNRHLLPNQIWHEAFDQGQVQVVGIITKSDVLSYSLGE